ncbi:MAG TPA: UvrD-helicase domain-containing protein, partial [Pseudonocardiaceae bacterium]|nr:UvrD-helicase domain-containing protein [Pseudonocardiaceae bacterium]
MPIDPELAAEQSYVELLYNRLDAEREAVRGQLDSVLRAGASGSEARWQREVSVASLTARLRGLTVAERGLCFGRLDPETGAPSYVGRIGLYDESAEYEPLLLDWRAPAARPFYTATAARPEGVARRRHFRGSGRTVVSLHDDVLTGGAAGQGSEALLAALNAPRGRRMRDIVATIQAEQDEIIRLGAAGIVVVEGGPGTGKTAVALHRVAYLMYTLRERISRWGVLVVGPNPGFLDYVGDVLPSLGETDVVFATPGELFPGLAVDAEDGADAKRAKGDLDILDVLAAAVADRQELPDHPVPIELDDVTVQLDDSVAAAARRHARSFGLPHNAARPMFRDALITGLVDRAVDAIGAGWLSPSDTAIRADLAADVRLELAGNREVARVVDRLWP